MTHEHVPGFRASASRADFWTVTAVVVLALWASAAPTITYPLYAHQWALTTAETTAMFATLPVALVLVLAVFGGLADFIGRRRTILLGLLASLAGAILFAVAPSPGYVFAARALTGVSVGLTMGPATAGMVEFSIGAAGKKRASAITTAASALGLAFAVLIAGTLIDLAPFPTHANFVVFGLALIGSLIAATRLPRHTPAETVGPWRPQLPRIPAPVRAIFTSGTLSVTAGFTIGAILLSLGADVARQLIGSTDALVGGGVIAMFALVMGSTAIAARTLSPRTSNTIGAAAGISSLVLLAVASSLHSLPVLLIFAATAGAGYALLFTSGLAIINAFAPEHHRAGMTSTTYLIAYFAQGLTALLLGAIATATTLQTAINWGCVGTGLLVVIAFLTARRNAQ